MTIETALTEPNGLDPAVTKRFLRSRIFAIATLAPAFAAASTLPSAAQAIGGDASAKPEVEVDLGALDSLGAPAQGASSGAARIILHAPGRAAPAASETPAAKKKRRAPAADGGEPVTPASLEPSPKQAAPENAGAAATAAAIAPSMPKPTETAVVPPGVASTRSSAPIAAPTGTAASSSVARALAAAAPAAATAAATEQSRAPSRILFAAKTAQLESAGKTDLDALAQWLGAHQQAQLRLMAYAAGGADEVNDARRLSLARALAVRAYLVEHGVSSARMEARVLGNRSEGGDPPDRVDIVTIYR
jgi:outer membrane protein OmpA-like peptidoglycan-associated protein